MSPPPSKRKILTDLILLVLEKSIDGYANFEDFIYNPLLERPVKKPLLSQAIKRLREKGFISKKTPLSQSGVSLTVAFKLPYSKIKLRSGFS